MSVNGIDTQPQGKLQFNLDTVYVHCNLFYLFSFSWHEVLSVTIIDQLSLLSAQSIANPRKFESAKIQKD